MVKEMISFLNRYGGNAAAAAAAKSLQSCPTLCDPRDSSPPGSPIPGILQARTLEWVAISFSNAWKWKVKVNSLSRVWLCATQETAAHQAPLSLGFSRQEYWSGLPFPSPILFFLGVKFMSITCSFAFRNWIDFSKFSTASYRIERAHFHFYSTVMFSWMCLVIPDLLP